MLSSQEEQREREQTLRNDLDVKRQQATMHGHAVAEAAMTETGRFAAINATVVTGATPIPKYPAASAHQADPVPDEPPLGYSVDQVEPIEPSAGSLLPAEQTDAPAGATASLENLPPVQDQSGDAGASFFSSHELGGSAPGLSHLPSGPARTVRDAEPPSNQDNDNG
jgi:hypothetical protein